MQFNLLSWLDASPAHYWLVAWSAFGFTAVLALVPLCFPRTKAWWQHPIMFSAAMLIVLLAFRWPLIFDNRQYPDPDESQFIAGASTLRHDPVFWRSVDGTTHGPLVQWPLLLVSLLRGSLDFTAARTMSILLIWIELVSGWLIFRHLFTASLAGILVLPLLAVHAFTQAWSFVAYGSEHVPNALLAPACWLLLTGWRQSGAGPPNLVRLFSAGVLLGAVPFAKLQAVPIAAVAIAAGVWPALLNNWSNWRQRLHLLGIFFGGTATVIAIILGMVWTSGVWTDFFYSYILDNIRYTGEREFSWADAPRILIALGGSIVGFNAFFLWLVIFGVCGLLLSPWFTRWHRYCSAFAVAMLLAAIFAAMVPGRAFIHYLQLVIFPAGLFGGLIAGTMSQDIVRDRLITGVSTRFVRNAVIVAFLGCGLIPQIWARLSEPNPFIGRFKTTHGALVQSEVSREILRYAAPGERLAMWGWMPAFWVESGLIQGTRDGNSSRQIEPSRYRNYFRARFLRDLFRTGPPVFIDAVGTGNFVHQDRAKSAHETFPELREYISDHYHLVRDVGGTRIYVRNDRL